jgi:hypothetical protein
MVPNYKFGEYGLEGTVKQQARTCAVTGKPLSSGDAFVRVPDTDLFYGLKAAVKRSLPDEVKQEIEAAGRATLKPASQPAKSPLPTKAEEK